MPSGAKNGKVSKEKKGKNLATRLKRFLSSKAFKQYYVKTVALTRAPENEGENHDLRFEALFTFRLAGHIDMLFFRCFRL